MLGYWLGANKALIHQYLSEISAGLVVFCVIVIGIYIWQLNRKKGKTRKV